MTESILTRDAHDALTDLRRQLHRQPETGFDLPVTATTLAGRLRAAGLEVTEGVGGSGVVATLARGSGRSIGLRADMDALPITEANAFDHRSGDAGRFHGCGHDGHSTMLLGAAEALAQDPELAGTVHFVFQPDEENGRGAQAMVDDGLFERFPMDEIYGLHNLPGLPVGEFATRTGAFTAFEEIFHIRVAGRGGHASAPELAIDPLVPAAAVVQGLQTIVSRSLGAADYAVVSATEFVTDGARNILPSRVRISGDVRGYDDAVSTVVERRMHELVEGIAAAHGAEGSLEYRREFAPTVNTGTQAEAAVAAARAVEGATVDPDHPRKGFSEDFARFLEHRPGCFMLLGNGTDGSHGAALHSPHYDFNDAAIPFGVAYWIRLARARLAA